MSYSGERHSTPKHPAGNLYVTQCGLTECHKGHQVPLRILARHAIHFILEGEGTYYVDGKSYHLRSGQGFMLFPDKPCRYTADSNHPWKYIYICFTGPGCQNLLYYTGIREEAAVFNFELTKDMGHDLLSMVYAGRDMRKQGYDVTGYFMLVMSRLVAAYADCVKKNSLSQHWFDKAILYIEDHYSEKISIRDIADYLGVERTYLYRLFMKNLGMSPASFLLSYRLERAEAMLRYKELSICDISNACGFYDQSHFARSFTEKYQMSPLKYRQTIVQ